MGYKSNFAEGSALSWSISPERSTLRSGVQNWPTGKAAPAFSSSSRPGDIEDDPNLTNQRFAGNPTQSFRSRSPLRIVAEVTNWTGHPADQVGAMKASALTKRDQSSTDSSEARAAVHSHSIVPGGLDVMS